MKALTLTIISCILGMQLFGQSLTVKSDAVLINFLADMDDTEGSIGGFEATINFNQDDLKSSRIMGSVDVNTLNTGIDKRDAHLKSKDFFHTEEYPEMSFESKSLEQDDEHYIMKGMMKIKGHEQEETIQFSYNKGVFRGECTIQLADYKVGRYGDMKPENTDVKISFFIPTK